MRTLNAVLLAFPLVLVASTGGAYAQNYPWCMVKSEARNCGFVSFDQCMAARKVGSFCEQNFLYRPEAGRTAPRKARR